MQRNKYLDEIGISIENYGVNFTVDSDNYRTKEWEKQREDYGFDERETWNMDITFAEWLYSHLNMFIEHTIIDLTYHMVDFQGTTYTQEEAIVFILEKCKNFLLEIHSNEEFADAKAFMDLEDAAQLWALIMPYCNW